MRTRHTWGAAVVALPLLLSACGGAGSDATTAPARQEPSVAQEAPPEAAAPTTEGGEGVYVGQDPDTLAGVELQLPTAANDPRVADVERFRKAAGAPAFTYVVGVLHNQQGVETIYTLQTTLAVVTDAGETVEFQHVAAPEWVYEQHVLHQAEGSLEAPVWAWYDGQYENQEVRPGARSGPQVWATTEPMPQGVQRVYFTFRELYDEVELFKK